MPKNCAWDINPPTPPPGKATQTFLDLWTMSHCWLCCRKVEKTIISTVVFYKVILVSTKNMMDSPSFDQSALCVQHLATQLGHLSLLQTYATVLCIVT